MIFTNQINGMSTKVCGIAGVDIFVAIDLFVVAVAPSGQLLCMFQIIQGIVQEFIFLIITTNPLVFMIRKEYTNQRVHKSY